MILDLATVALGYVFPSIMDFVKKKFLGKGKDTLEATVNSLATTKPEVIQPLIEAQAMLLEAKATYFNRDIGGVPAMWVVNLRAIIRPLVTILSFGIIFVSLKFTIDLNTSIQEIIEISIASWLGSR